MTSEHDHASGEDAGEAHVLRILRDALDAAPTERDAYLSMRCGSDTTLRQRVAALLERIGAESDGEDDAQDATPREHSRDDESDALIGARIGAFRIVERVGRGGMGVVYRAIREEADFAQDVAIKLIRRGFDFDDIRARFLRERRILARLSHPNLARFIDGGVVSDGRPWFALEFVRGAPITRWCEMHALDVRARVRLFIDVCAAVQHAHGALVVHRDLKPGNVLVDDSGAPRLLDFGVATLLRGDDIADDPTTIAQRHAMTPEYAAPEQLAGEGGGVGVDVYALGTILFELIAGVLPYVFANRDVHGVARALAQNAPASLANAPFRDGDATTRLAARVTNARAYRRLVRGDLSRIVDKALAKDPERRYPTVEAFAGDLARWLGGEPVRASGDGAWYRLRKLVARNRTAALLGAIAAVALAGFALFHVASLREQLAQTEAQRGRAQASLDLLQRLLTSPDPQTEFGPKTTLGDFLAAAYATIRTNHDIDADVRGEIAVTIAASLRGIERYDEALALAREVAAAPVSSAAGWRNRVAALGEIGQVQTLQGAYKDSLATLDEGAAIASAHGVDDPLVMATLFSTQAVAHNHLAEWDESIVLSDRAVATAEPIREREPAFYANLLGFASIPRGYPRTDLPAAEALLRRSLAFQETHGLRDSGLYPNTKGELAQTLIDEGRFEDAEPMLRNVVDEMRQRYGADNRETSFKVSNLALLYFRWNRLDDARRWRDEATRSMAVALGEKHPFMALAWIESADLAFQAGDAARADHDAKRGSELADENDHDEFTQRAVLYAAHAQCLDGVRGANLADAGRAADVLDARVAALGDAFGVRPFDVRLAAARCDAALGRRDAALAAIEPFAARIAAGEKISRTDYIGPAIAKLREQAGVPASPATREATRTR